MRLIRILSFGMVFVLAFGQTPKAPPRKAQIREIRATGCVRIAQNGCVVVKTLDGASAYSFEASPKPDANAVVTIQATPHQGASPCSRLGMAVDVTDWEPTGEQCVPDSK